MKANQPTPEIGNDLTTTNNNKETINMANNQPTCPKCLGTGKYNVPLKDGSIGNCFTCKGTGFKKVNTNPMSEAQVNLIRNLFKELQQVLAKDEKNEIIKIMTAHIAVFFFGRAKTSSLSKCHKPRVDGLYTTKYQEVQRAISRHRKERKDVASAADVSSAPRGRQSPRRVHKRELRTRLPEPLLSGQVPVGSQEDPHQAVGSHEERTCRRQGSSILL